MKNENNKPVYFTCRKITDMWKTPRHIKAYERRSTNRKQGQDKARHIGLEISEQK